MSHPATSTEEIHGAWLAGVAILAVALAWRIRFVLDDAFISFHYARSWVEGNGLTWFGAHVEGYTTFGWVAWLAGGFLAGADPVSWAHAGSLTSLVAALCATWVIAARAASSRERQLSTALLATLTLTVNYSFLAFATSGLETMLQTALVLGAFLCAQRAWAAPASSEPTPLPFLCVSAFAGFALLVRLDSAVLLTPIAIWSAAAAVRTGHARRVHFRALVLPLLLLVGPWLAWKLHYYGDLLPNSFYAKVPLDEFSLDGARQWARFALWYGFAPIIVVLCAAALWQRLKPRHLASVITMLAVLASHFLYLLWVGGDFMEFRFMVPVAPYFALLVASLVDTTTLRSTWRERLSIHGICLASLALSSAVHAHTYVTDPDLRMDGVSQLATFYGVYPDENWSRVGTALAREFGDTEAVIATTAAGAVPYFSRLPTIDLFGLNDRTIPRLGIRSAYRRPGHRSQASFEYLHERGLNLIVGNVLIVNASQLRHPGSEQQLRSWAHAAVPPQSGAPREIEILAMPLETAGAESSRGEKAASSWLLLWYLGPTPQLDRVTAQWQRVRIPFEGDSSGAVFR
jgi:arabinofuranosyltransferase